MESGKEQYFKFQFLFLRLKTFLHDQLFPKDESQKFGTLINSLTSWFQNIHCTVDSYMGIKHEQGKQKIFWYAI